VSCSFSDPTFEELIDGVPLATIMLWTRHRAIRFSANGWLREPPKAAVPEFRYVAARAAVQGVNDVRAVAD